MEPRALAAVVAAGLAAGLAAAGPATAAVVELRTYPRLTYGQQGAPIHYTDNVVAFTAAPGEGNRPRVSVGPDRAITLADPGARLLPGASCAAQGEHAVTCRPGAGPLGLTLELGDGDDTVAPGALPAAGLSGATVAGGPGDDSIALPLGKAEGGEGDDRLVGAPGGQSLSGGPGADVLSGGPGDDGLHGGAGRDVLRGGPGADAVSWAGEAARVAVDLAAGGEAGTVGEPDRIIGAERATGGEGDDVLLGSDGANELTGGGGDDRVEGRSGPDELRGGRGDDLLRGGRGNDSLDGDSYEPGDAGADTLEGGAGRDHLDGQEGSDFLRGGDGGDTIEVPPGARGVDGGAGGDEIQYDGRYRSPAAWRALALSCGPGRDDVWSVEVPAVHPRDCEAAFVEDELHVRTRLRRTRTHLHVPLPYDCFEAPTRCPVRIELRDTRGRLLARRRAPRPFALDAAFRIDARLRRALRRRFLEVRYRFEESPYRLRVPTPPR